MARRAALRNRRGSMFIWFSLIAFPMIILGGMLATDFASTVLADNEVGLLAEAAATAGAWQIEDNSTMIRCLPSGVASAVAHTDPSAVTIDGFPDDDAGAVAHTFVTDNEPQTLHVARFVSADTDNCHPGSATTPGSVEVTIYYSVPASAFYTTLTGLLGDEPDDHTLHVTRVAKVCIPGNTHSLTAGASCSRPQ